MECRNFNDFKKHIAHSNGRCPFKKTDAGLDLHISEKLEDVDIQLWDQLVGDTSVYLRSNYLAALEASFDEGLDYRYASFFKDDEFVGLAAFQITNFESGDLTQNLRNPIIKRITKAFGANGKSLRYRVLVAGNAFATGEHNFRFKDSVNDERQFAAVIQAIDIISQSEKERGQKVSAIVVKDFYPESFSVSRKFADDHYGEFFVDPNMVMPIKASWSSFDDYLDSLTSKYRTKARAAFKRSGDLEIRELGTEDLENHHEEFLTLYEQVYSRAEFKLGKLNFESFLNLRKKLDSEFLLKGYFLNGKLVGFQSGFQYNQTLDAHFVGIDYSKNYDYAIYSRMLYDYVDEAIRRKVKRVSFGRTAMEIKSTVGAFPVDLKCYIRHRSNTPNRLLQLMFNYVKPSEFEQRVPYKKQELSQITSMW